MRITVVAVASLVTAIGTVAAHGQTSSPGGAPSTGPASGISPGRATSLSPGGTARPSARGLPSNPGLSEQAGGRPQFRDRFDGTRPGDRFRRLDDLGRSNTLGRSRARDRRDRMTSGESTDRFPASRTLPLRPGSPADARREQMRPPGLEAEGSPSASRRREVSRRTGADFNQRECEQIYDSGTGMNRQQWSDSCRRVGQRFQQMERWRGRPPPVQQRQVNPQIITPQVGSSR